MIVGLIVLWALRSTRYAVDVDRWVREASVLAYRQATLPAERPVQTVTHGQTALRTGICTEYLVNLCRVHLRPIRIRHSGPAVN